MSLYTVRGSADLDARIGADMKRIAEVASPHCLAGVLIGGYGRGEGTPFISPDGTQVPFNDYDLVVIVDKLSDGIRQKFRALEKQLTAELGFPVDLYPSCKTTLPKCEVSLLNYEMKHGHKVAWGDEDILSALPDYPHDAIPLSEGSRLLLNRGKLLLDIRQRLANPEPLDEEERIRFIKFIHKVLLAFGDCALLAAGQYDVSYAVKKVRFPAIGYCPDRDFIVEGYLKAIELKDWGDFRSLESFDVETELQAVQEVFLRFMPWYRTQCSGREGSALKNVALNLKWIKRLCTAHPREQLYDAITDLLRGRPSISAARFYELQRRFS